MSALACNCSDQQTCSCNQPASAQPTYSFYHPAYPAIQTPPLTPYGPQQWSYPVSASSNPFYSELVSAPPAQTYPGTFQNVFPSSYNSPSRTVLGSNPTVNITNNLPSTSMTSQTTGSSAKRKRAPNGSTATASKRLNNTSSTGRDREAENNPIIPQQAVPGVGPQNSNTDTTSEQHPSLTRPTRRSQHLGSILNNSSSDNDASGATDVWYFMRALQVQAKPATLPERDNILKKRPDASKFPFVGCRLCTGTAWTTWKNVEGQTSCIRHHLKQKHQHIWREVVTAEKLKGWQTFDQKSTQRAATEREPFSLAGFYNRLIRWISVDDQSLDVVDCRELRDLLLFLNEDLAEKDVPHRSKLSELITLAFQREYRAVLHDIQNSLGRVSFTSDIWSRQNMKSYMAVTAHYSAKDSHSGKLVLRAQLVAFRELQGSHSGVNIGKVFLQVVKEINCLDKISMITLDNASNNQKMMSELQIELHKIGIPFDKNGNRIRCFPHVINIAVKAGLKALTQAQCSELLEDIGEYLYDNEFMYGTDVMPPLDSESLPDLPPELTANPEYLKALEGDVVGSIRRYVTACRSSGQRREQFEAILKQGNEAGGWGDTNERLRNVGLLKDVDTRWSATFNMLDRFLETYLVSRKLIEINGDLSQYSFSDLEIKVASDIRQFLYIFHVVQELVSAEKTPTLSIVLPVYEKLIIMLKMLRSTLPELAHGIDASTAKLEEYLAISRGNRVYGLAMVINPTIKFQWLKENWTSANYMLTRTSVINTMIEYQKSLPSTASQTTLPRAPISRRIIKTTSASGAALSQASGLARFHSLARSLSSPNITPSSSDKEGPPSGNPTTVESAEELARRLDDEARRAVTVEILAYETEGLIDGDQEVEELDLLQFWQKNQSKYPLLYKIALDILPVQASAVPCERVFSSSKETDADRRSNMSMFTMEELQILKFGYRKDRLNFTENLICSEHELSVLDISPSAVRDLMSRGEIEKLNAYINESWEGWGQERL